MSDDIVVSVTFRDPSLDCKTCGKETLVARHTGQGGPTERHWHTLASTTAVCYRLDFNTNHVQVSRVYPRCSMDMRAVPDIVSTTEGAVAALTDAFPILMLWLTTRLAVRRNARMRVSDCRDFSTPRCSSSSFGVRTRSTNASKGPSPLSSLFQTRR